MLNQTIRLALEDFLQIVAAAVAVAVGGGGGYGSGYSVRKRGWHRGASPGV
jgi:hypothetical protein